MIAFQTAKMEIFKRTHSIDGRVSPIYYIYIAGWALFAHKGDQHVGVKEIARAAGVAVGSYYAYVPDKQALFWKSPRAANLTNRLRRNKSYVYITICATERT